MELKLVVESLQVEPDARDRIEVTLVGVDENDALAQVAAKVSVDALLGHVSEEDAIAFFGIEVVE